MRTIKNTYMWKVTVKLCMPHVYETFQRNITTTTSDEIGRLYMSNANYTKINYM